MESPKKLSPAQIHQSCKNDQKSSLVLYHQSLCQYLLRKRKLPDALYIFLHPESNKFPSLVNLFAYFRKLDDLSETEAINANG